MNDVIFLLFFGLDANYFFYSEVVNNLPSILVKQG